MIYIKRIQHMITRCSLHCVLHYKELIMKRKNVILSVWASIDITALKNSKKTIP